MDTDHTHMTVIPVSEGEWRMLSNLVEWIIEHDERRFSGQVRLRSDGSRRTWSATNGPSSALVDAGADDLVVDVGVSPALVRFATNVVDAEHEPPLLLDPTSGRVGVGTEDRVLWTEDLGHGFPDLAERIPDPDAAPGRVTMRTPEFWWLFDTIRKEREDSVEPGEDRSEPHCWLEVDDGLVRVVNAWPEAGDVVAELRVPSAKGSVAVEVYAFQMQRVFGLMQPDDEVELLIPKFNEDPLVFRTPHVTALVAAVPLEARRARDRVEAVLERAFGRLALDLDADGHYPLSRRSTQVSARMHSEARTPFLKVFAVVLDGVEAGPELLAELNDLNANLEFARLYHRDGQVLATVDLVAATLDDQEVWVAARRIDQLATEVMPTVSAVLGGAPRPDPLGQRADLYRATVLEAEITPGGSVALNGPDAVAEWPFPGPAHVITGWNPQGAQLARARNEEMNGHIAADVLRRGGRFVHGVGRSPSGDHAEESLVVWGLTRADARDMGWRANQDAVFEVDADQVHLVWCVDDRVDTWSRHPSAD